MHLDGTSIPGIATQFHQPEATVRPCVQKALAYGPRRALDDLPRAGRARRITPEARAWIIRLACQKPKDLGWASEFWSMALLARYLREHAATAGHPTAARVGKGMVAKIIAAHATGVGV